MKRLLISMMALLGGCGAGMSVRPTSVGREAAWVDAVVDRLIDACLGDRVGGLLALPLADTLKQERAGRVAETLARDGKWAAQTPQMFRLGLLREALAAAGATVTDESGAVEALGHAPLLVPGELENFKLTHPGDFALAQRLLRAPT